MWRSTKFNEKTDRNGEKISKVSFYEVGVTRESQRSFKVTFRKTLEHSTPRKAHDAFVALFSRDEEFRNRFLIERGLEPEAAWSAKQELLFAKERRKAQEKSFADLFRLWRAGASSEWSAKYAQLVDGFWRVLESEIGSLRVGDLTPEALGALDSKLVSKGNSRSTVNRKIAFVLRVVRFAHRRRVIAENPLEFYEKQRDPRPKNDFWTEAEIAHFLAIANERYPPESPRRWVYVAYLAAFTTGLRANELWALRPCCMRPERRSLWISEQWSPLEKEFAPLKARTEGNGRFVPMSDSLQSELEALQIVRKLKPSDLFFSIDPEDPWYRPWCKPGASPVDHANFAKRAWRTDLKRSGNRPIRFHDCRHSAATLMRERGASREEVQSNLGHSSSATTRRYDHASDRSAERVAALLALKPSKSSQAQADVAKHATSVVLRRSNSH